MRKVLMMLSFYISIAASATDYYVSSTGNDSSTGLTSSTPWKTISKVNSVFSNLKAGDRILFKRGETFYGGLTLQNSGSSGSPISIGAYGTGSNPVITGFTTVTGWNSYGNGIYYKALSCESAPNIVSVNDENTAMGRWPNAGEYMTVDSHSSNTSIYDAALPSSPNWTGAEIVIRKNKYIWDRNLITSHSATTIYYTSASDYSATNGYGYFIQNSLTTLDRTGEWYYDGTNFYMYFGSADPSSYTVKVSTTDQLAYVNEKNYISFDNISFTGANLDAIQIRNSSYITITNCSINFTGNTAIYGPWWGTSSNCTINNTTISNSNSNGICFNGDHTNATITNNTITKTGVLVGMGGSGDGTYNAVHAIGNNTQIQYNVVQQTGYIGIHFGGNNTVVSNNLVDGFNLLKDDGSGIYTYVGTGTAYTGDQVTNNIIINGYGYKGASGDNEILSAGIYLDDRTRQVTLKNNTIANCNMAGIYLHNAHEINIINNTLYNNGSGHTDYGGQMLLIHDDYSPDDPIRNISMNNNIFVSRTSGQFILAFSTPDNSIPSFGTSNYNCFAKPIDNSKIIRTWSSGWYSSAVDMNFSGWKSFTSQDGNSYESPISLTDINKIRFEYNASNSNKVVTLDACYIDVKGTKYTGSITIAPYSSAVLMVDPNPSTTATVPVYVSSSIANATPAKLEITYNTTLSSTIPSVSAFTVRVNSTARTINSVTVSGTKVILTLSSAIVSGDVVTVAYTKPSSNPLQTPAGGQAASIAAQTVTNNVGSTNIAPVAVVSYKSSAYSGFVSEINASGSYDANKDRLTFTWTVPSNVDVSSTTGSTIEFLSPIVNETKKVEFTVNVSDGKTTQSKSIPVEILPYEPNLDIAKVINIEASGYQTPYYPYNIIDGNIGTMWSVNGADQWLILELQDPFSIQHVKLSFQPGQTKESYFDVFGSNDKETWEPILTKEASCSFSGDLQVFDFPPSKAVNEYKYIKLVGEANSVDTWNSISEFRIFGYKHKYPTSYDEQPVKIYPNPASEFFNVKIVNSEFAHDFIRIVSITGSIMYDEKTDPAVNEFRVPIDLKKGVYIVQMGSGDMTVFSQKLVVNN